MFQSLWRHVSHQWRNIALLQCHISHQWRNIGHWWSQCRLFTLKSRILFAKSERRKKINWMHQTQSSSILTNIFISFAKKYSFETISNRFLIWFLSTKIHWQLQFVTYGLWSCLRLDGLEDRDSNLVIGKIVYWKHFLLTVEKT